MITSLFRDTIGLAGITAIAVGLWQLSPPIALIVVGSIGFLTYIVGELRTRPDDSAKATRRTAERDHV